jgi:4-amino-4-deoxy-L-arabinose transferase-like glycosyltransferase
LHLGFLLPALAVIFLTYYLAREFTDSPLIAAGATLVAPDFLVSASSVMCDTMMVAIWLLAVILWLKGQESGNPSRMLLSALLIGICALTKYFGASLIPLLFAYSLYRNKRLGTWAYYLLVPATVLALYQFWTASLYGQGLLVDAAGYANAHRQNNAPMGGALVGISFIGGCMFPALTFIPLIWTRLQILLLATLSAVATWSILSGLLSIGQVVGGTALVQNATHDYGFLFSAQLGFYIAGGLSVLGLAIMDFWETRTAKSLLLMLWVLGTFAFASFFNWTVNARSVLPLLPAAAILIARRLDMSQAAKTSQTIVRFLVPLLASACLALWVTSADSQLANSARTAAVVVHEKYKDVTSRMWFEGHWGFQYYMEQFGARPLEARSTAIGEGDLIVVPENNTEMMEVNPAYVAKTESFWLPGPGGATTMSSSLGAGFYAAYWGPLPFAVGPVPVERYVVLHMKDATKPLE